MARLPGIEVEQNVAGPVGQKEASTEDFVPGWRQVDTALRQAGDSTEALYRGGEAAALQQQREALSTGEIGDAIQRLTDPIEKRYKQTDVSNQQVLASRLHMQWAKHALDRIKTGDVHDPNLVDGFLGDFDENTSDLVNQANTPEGKLYLTHALAEMRAQFGTQVMAGQSERAGEQIKKDSLEAVNNRSETVRVNPAMLPQALQDHARDTKITARMLGGSQELSEALRLQGGKTIAVSALEGLVLTNPQVVKQQAALPLEQRDPIFKAASRYLDGETMNRIRANADSRIKNEESEKRQKIALARQEEQRGREIQAGQIFNAIGAKQATVNGLPIKDAIAKLAASGGGFHLAENLSNVFKASGLDGTLVAGNPSTYLRINKEIAEGNRQGWTATTLMNIIGRRDKTGAPDGLDDHQFAMLAERLQHINQPERQMDERILHTTMTAVEHRFNDKMLTGVDQTGLVAERHQQYVIDTYTEYNRRVNNGEHGTDIMDPKKPGSLASPEWYNKYLPTIQSVLRANGDPARRRKLDPVEVAKAQGIPDPESFGKVAVKQDPAAPLQLPEDPERVRKSAQLLGLPVAPPKKQGKMASLSTADLPAEVEGPPIDYARGSKIGSGLSGVE